jgi:hypothetical protein
MTHVNPLFCSFAISRLSKTDWCLNPIAKIAGNNIDFKMNIINGDIFNTAEIRYAASARNPVK